MDMSDYLTDLRDQYRALAKRHSDLVKSRGAIQPRPAGVGLEPDPRVGHELDDEERQLLTEKQTVETWYVDGGGNVEDLYEIWLNP
jgi:hypothetical protein